VNLLRKSFAVALMCALYLVSFPVAIAAESDASVPTYTVKDAGGSVGAKTGDKLKLTITSTEITIGSKDSVLERITPSQVTDLSFGQEVHHRIGTAAGLAVVSLGIGALVAFSKSKKDFIGMTWDTGTSKGGLVVQADKNEYRGILMALEGVTGKKAVDTDPQKK
jgi:hypothetical protein